MEPREGDGSLFVPFAPAPLDRQRSGAFAAIALGLGFGIAAGVATHTVLADSFPRFERVLLALFAAVLSVASLLGILGGLRMLAVWIDRGRGRKSAFAVGPEGALVGFGWGAPFFLRWAEIASFRVEGGLPGDPRTIILQFHPKDVAALKRRVGVGRWLFSAWADTVDVPYQWLDVPWPELLAALERFARVETSWGTSRDAVPVRWPKTLEEFRERFQKAPLGVWTTAEFSNSPGDTTVWFCRDGSGGISSGAAGFLGHGSEIEWRERGDWSIEIRLAEEGEPWLAYDYRFEAEKGKIRVFFDEGETEAWIEGLGADLFTYDGPCWEDR